MSTERLHFKLAEFSEIDESLRAEMDYVLDYERNSARVEFQQFNEEIGSFTTAVQWHTDGNRASINKLVLAMSHLPTLHADVVIEYNRQHPHFLSRFCIDPSFTMTNFFGNDWVEVAERGSLDETRDYGIYVRQAYIVQQLPYTRAYGPMGTTLHRAATYDGPPHFKKRAFYKDLFVE